MEKHDVEMRRCPVWCGRYACEPGNQNCLNAPKETPLLAKIDEALRGSPAGGAAPRCSCNRAGTCIACLVWSLVAERYGDGGLVYLLHALPEEAKAVTLLREAARGLYNRFEPDNQSELWLRISRFLNGESAEPPIPVEFAQLAAFYGATDLVELVRIQEERIESMRQKLPTLPGPETDPRSYRRG